MNIHQQVKDPTGIQHRWVFDFEMIFFNKEKFIAIQRWMINWWWISIIYAFIYIVLVLSGQEWMKKRSEKYQLRSPLILWNSVLALFSFWGLCRCLPELFYTLAHHGFRYSVCDATYKEGVTGLWVWLFMASKFPETVDTLFIVLRRQPLIFLHWYHHASVLVYCFYSYTYFASTGRWFVSMNYFIHTIMYGYFAFRAAQIRVPRSIQQSITFLQLIQMFIGCLINFVAYDSKRNEYRCETSTTNIVLSLMLYASYLLLFAHFFYSTYLQKDSLKKGKDRVD